MIDQAQLELLMHFQPGDVLVTSVYLNVDGRRFTRKEYEILLKDLLRGVTAQLDTQPLTNEQKRSAQEDIRKIQDYVSVEYDGKGAKSLALFSSSGRKFWQVYRLPLPVKSRAVVEPVPSVRPLSVLLDEYKRYCTVVVGREKARIFEVFLGEIQEHSDIFNEVPSRVREGGFRGYAERRIERHIEDHVHQHLKHVADLTLDIFKRRHFDRLILGARPELLPLFESHLHTYLRERLAARLHLDPSLSVHEALRKTLEVEQDLKRREEQHLVRRLGEEAGAHRNGVTGLEATLVALRRGQVHTLILTEGFAAPGFLCPGCHNLTTCDAPCAYCGKPLQGVPDVVEEAVDFAIHQNCHIEYVFNNHELQEAGNIGAILRFRS